MKYWLLTTEYPPFYGGGISTYCRFTAKMFSEQRHALTVFVSDGSVKNINIERTDGLRIIRFNPNATKTTSFLGHTTNLSYAFAQIVRKYIEAEGKPDIIEAQEYLGIAYYLLNYRYLLYDWCQNIPVLITTHSPAFLYLHYNHVPAYRYPDYWIGEMERFCLQAADHLISPSSYLIETIRKYFALSNNNFSIVANPFVGVETPEEEANPLNEKIIFYGKLSAQKGTFKLLAYFENIWNSGFEEPLYLYGGQDIVYHPEGKTMGAIVRERYSSLIVSGKLKLLPPVAPTEMALHFRNAKLVIVPSTIDNFPYVVLEMMSLGNILLVSIQGGQAEIIQDGINGFVFDHEQPDSFQLQLSRVLNLGEPEKTVIRKRAQETVADRYNLNVVYHQKMSVIQNLIDTYQKPVAFPYIRHLPVLPVRDAESFQKGLLSLVIPYYNMGKYIEETIAAVEASTYTPKEIIIVNDGSKDKESLEVLNRLRKNGNLKILDTNNNGLAGARNRGAKEAQGEYLAFLDADDTVTADYYTKAIQVLSTYSNVHFVGCWTQYFEGSTNIWPTFTPEPPIILYHNTINSSALVYKRSAFLQGGKNDPSMVFPGLEDYESVISLIANGYRGVVIPEVLFHYRVRKDSMIRGLSVNKKLFLAEYMAKKHKGLYATFAPETMGLAHANGAGFLLDNPSLDYASFIKNIYLDRFVKKTIGVIKRNPVLKQMALTIYRKFKS